MNTQISKAILSALVVGGLASTAAMAGVTNPKAEYRPTGKGYGQAVSGRVEDAAKPGGGARPSTGITLHGGPVMVSTVNVYYIWYGNWSTTSGTAAQPVLVNFAQSIGNSPYYNINKTYYNSANVHVTGNVTYAGSTTVGYTQGPASTSLSDAQILNIVSDALNSHAFGANPDPNGIYFVLTSADVHKSGFGTSYCGWHTHATYTGGYDVKYSFVGDPSTQYPSSCGAQVTGPNGNSGADAMASIIAHELEEAVTDPDLNAWYDRSGQENADKCAWTFGTTYTANGATANVKLGTKDYLIQQNWSASTQKCGML